MEKTVLNISGMHCASCASNIEGALKRAKGVYSARVNFALEKAYIEFEPERLNIHNLILVIQRSGYKATVPNVLTDQDKKIPDKEVKGLKLRFAVSIILSSILMYVSMG